MDNTQIKWQLFCTNPDCNFATEKYGSDPDFICNRCGGEVEVTEIIVNNQNS